MLRILQVVNVMDRAGLETMIMNYYRNIDRRYIQFDFLTHRLDKGAYEDEILSMGGRVFHAPRLYPQNYRKYFQYMRNLFEEYPEYQIIHSHIDTMSTFPLYAAKKNKIPIRIAHSHTSRLDFDKKILIKYLAKLAIPKVANIYCSCGDKAGKFLYGRESYTVIHNAIDLEKFQFNNDLRRKKRKELGVENEFVIGHVGRYCYIKNQKFLIDIFMEILKKKQNSKLLLIGKGEDEKILRKKVMELSLDKKVLFLIDRTDVSELYQTMDVFVMPSVFEGLPVVGVEAQANGLPCIISDAISKEVALTDSVYMMNLTQTAEEWAEKILLVANGRNTTSIEQLKKKGYDVNIEAEKLTEWYIKLANSV